MKVLLKGLVAFIFVVSTSVLAAASPKAVGCFEDGECSGGVALGHTNADTVEDCAMECEAFEGCGFFTHYRASKMCIQFKTCPDLDKDCFDCVSGRNGCSCMEQGRCEGVMANSDYTLDEFACLEHCRNNTRCNWMTYTRSSRFCAMLEDCSGGIDGSYEDDVSAPKFCSGPPGEEPVYVMAALGNNDASSDLDDVEVVDIGTGASTCPKLPAYPLELTRAEGAFVDGKARICGGYGSSTTSACYEYSYGDDSWTLSDYSLYEARNWHESIVLANGSWLLVGGNSGSSDTTDIYEDGVMQRGPDLPTGFSFPVGTLVNSTHIFLADTGDTNYLVDVEAWEFTELPDLALSRFDFMCGMVENKDGVRELVVAGGDAGFSGPFHDSVEIFNFGTMEWREGPALPGDLTQAEVVQLSKTFVIIGGRNTTSTCVNTVYQFDNENYGWILKEGNSLPIRFLFTD